MAEQYLYAVARVHTHENNLLSGSDIEAMVSAPNAAAVLSLLNDKGWDAQPADAANPAPMLARQSRAAWALVEEITGGLAPFAPLLVTTDYHNLKAAIKLAYSGESTEDGGRYRLEGGSIPWKTLQEAAATHDFSALPPAMAEAGREAYETLAQTGNGQACDMVLDRATLVALDEAGKASESELLRQWAVLTVDTANIKAAVRSCRMGKSEDFISRAVAPAGTLDAARLAKAAATGEDEIYSYLQTTGYAGAVDMLKTSMAAFERWANDQVIQAMRPQLHNYSTVEPLVAYLLARENEIAMVRVILSAKNNGLGEEPLRERLREMYV